MEMIVIGLIAVGAIYMVVNNLIDQLKGSDSCHDCGGCGPGCTAKKTAIGARKKK